MKRVALVALLAIVMPVFALNQANIEKPMHDVNGVVDNTPDSLEKALTARPVAGSTRRGSNPVLFLVGNSTMRTGTLGNGDNGQWGWGYYFHEFFDEDRISVENHALGGMSSRTFYKHLWPDVVKGVKKGDYIIIELGHNDNGPYDSGRARASIPGVGHEWLPVVIKETGQADTVLTYGEYMRRFVKDVKQRGANPLLFSLTPRKAWTDADSSRIVRVDSTYGLWARQIAEEEGIPFVDLNDISASKFEHFGKKKVETMFYLDRIHTSAFGAKENARSAAEGLRRIDSSLKDYLKEEKTDTITGRSRLPGRPVLFIIGDSTVKNEDKDSTSMWGWGSVLAPWFKTDSISVENHAMAGRSARTFLDEGRWDRIYNALQPGDFVIMQFGHNDGGDISIGKARGELHGNGPESKVFKMEKTGINQVVYTYGWYLRKFIYDAREKGAEVVVVSHTPRNRWHDGYIESNRNDFGLWARQAAIQAGASFIDLNSITGRRLQALGQEKAAEFFRNDHTHSSLSGAELNARGIVDGLRKSNSRLKNYLKDTAPLEFDLGTECGAYDEYRGYGIETFGRDEDNKSQSKFFSVEVPDGNYIVKVRFLDKMGNGSTVVRSESRRLMLASVSPGTESEYDEEFVVNKRSAHISLADSVKLNRRELSIPTWDEKLTLEFAGNGPTPQHLSIRPVMPSDSVTTVFLAGNSTVVDQAYEPWCSWGQIFPSFFDSRIAISNHAESGESASSFLSEKRLDRILATASPGDWLFIEFGHNDQKEKGEGKGAWYNFTTNLKIMIDRARKAGVNTLLITPAGRRIFNHDGTATVNTHGDYVDAVRILAKRENVPLIDLNAMSRTLYEALGEEGSKDLFVHFPANTFPGQTEPLADNTHFNPAGAHLLALCITRSLAKVAPELAAHLRFPVDFSPSDPRNAAPLFWPISPLFESEKPYGD